MSAVMALLLGVVVVLLITAVTGYFVAQEFAFMAVDRSSLGASAAAGDATAQRTLDVTRRTSFMLSGAQLGITVTGLLVGYVAEPLIGESVGTVLGGVGIPSGVALGIGAIGALLFSTFAQMLFGELFPKNLAIARPDQVSRALARSTSLYLRVFGWLIGIFDRSSNVLLRVLGIEPVHDVEHSATPRDLEHIVSQSGAGGHLPTELSLLLGRMLDFHTRTVEHAMIPRPRVAVVRAGDTVEHVLELMRGEHSRYPVLEDNSDTIVGVVHLLDAMAVTSPAVQTIRDIARPAVVLAESQSLGDAAQSMQALKAELACVIDEYGGFAGIVTTEDIAEELVGEIADEHDDSVDAEEQLEPNGTSTLPGSLHIDELERMLGHALPSGSYETLAGLVIERHGGLPHIGTTLDVDVDPTSADLVADGDTPLRSFRIEVREIENYVPTLLVVSMTEKALEI